jgi:hypothetical protein
MVRSRAAQQPERPETVTGRRLRIEYLPLSDVRQYPRNAKGHDSVAIRTSFERFGFVNPIIVNESNGQLLAGHGRLEVLSTQMTLGGKAPDGVEVAPDGTWLVPVVRGVELVDGEHGAYTIADNHLVETGGWNQELELLLAELDKSGGLEGLGYDSQEVERLLQQVAADGGTPSGRTDERMELQAYEHYDYVVMMFRDQRDWMRATTLLGIKRVEVSATSKKRRLGMGRVVDGRRILNLLEGKRADADPEPRA